MSNETVAGFILLTAVILKKLNPLSTELNPVPVSPNFWRPSTNISSSTEKGGTEKPSIGVTSVQVTIPTAASYTNLLTVDPLSLSIANISWVTDCNPLGGTMTSTLLKELLATVPVIVPVVSLILVTGLTIIKLGVDV